MLSDSEWIEIYRYLLQSLLGIADNSLILHIERAASARIEEDSTEDSEIIKQFSRESREDLDPIRLRSPTPREAFTAAIGVLIARLREVPALADSLVKKFGYPASSIQWKPDVSEGNQISEQGFFLVEQLKLEKREREEVESALRRLESLLEDRE